ncbi:MAG: SDR family NAD(P)-dependent oxidoreductase, partial [Bacteroidota bacterium]|nr:SDR family NAD(P)-dependent oxidoreductase [Bacteroidota bacterium]
MNIHLEYKHALVCGASKGIGKAIAFALAEAGASVTLVARNAEELADIMTRLPQNSHAHHQFIAADFNNPEDVQKKIHQLVLHKSVDILINNTGGPPAGMAIDAEPAAFELAFRQHLICNQVLVKLVVPGMK